MKIIENQTFDQERAFYGSDGVTVRGCEFCGAADGESAFKESKNITVEGCRWELRYPFWHDENVDVRETVFEATCRAPFWYSSGVKIFASGLHGTKAFRECDNVNIRSADIISDEFGWYCRNVDIANSSASGEYFLMHTAGVTLKSFSLKGKYSFQYVTDAVIENCNLDTKDAFWHAKRVTVKNSTVKGEYLAWYAEDITFINCRIIGTQPLCYCKGLRLIDCEMIDADLAFEKSEVEAILKAPIISIKNPASGSITVPSVQDTIIDDPNSRCVITLKS